MKYNNPEQYSCDNAINIIRALIRTRHTLTYWFLDLSFIRRIKSVKVSSGCGALTFYCNFLLGQVYRFLSHSVALDLIMMKFMICICTPCRTGSVSLFSDCCTHFSPRACCSCSQSDCFPLLGRVLQSSLFAVSSLSLPPLHCFVSVCRRTHQRFVCRIDLCNEWHLITFRQLIQCLLYALSFPLWQKPASPCLS